MTIQSNSMQYNRSYFTAHTQNRVIITLRKAKGKLNKAKKQTRYDWLMVANANVLMFAFLSLSPSRTIYPLKSVDNAEYVFAKYIFSVVSI